MLPGSRFLRAITVATCVALSAGTPASAASWLEKSIYLIGPRYDGVLPPCDAALGWIASRFAQKEGRFWNSSCRSSASTEYGKSHIARGLLRRYRAVTVQLSPL